jgi:hypothetical protein
MSKKVWVVRYYLPGKFDKVLEWNTSNRPKARERQRVIDEVFSLKKKRTGRIFPAIAINYLNR